MTSYPELSQTIPGTPAVLSRPFPIGEDSSRGQLKAKLSDRTTGTNGADPTRASSASPHQRLAGNPLLPINGHLSFFTAGLSSWALSSWARS